MDISSAHRDSGPFLISRNRAYLMLLHYFDDPITTHTTKVSSCCERSFRLQYCKRSFCFHILLLGVAEIPA